LYCINAYDLLQAVTLDQTSRQTKWDFSFYEYTCAASRQLNTLNYSVVRTLLVRLLIAVISWMTLLHISSSLWRLSPHRPYTIQMYVFVFLLKFFLVRAFDKLIKLNLPTYLN